MCKVRRRFIIPSHIIIHTMVVIPLFRSLLAGVMAVATVDIAEATAVIMAGTGAVATADTVAVFR